MSDPIHQQFLRTQAREAQRFCQANPGLCEIRRLPDARFLVHLNCPSLRLRPGSAPEVVRGCQMGVIFDPDYCRRFNPHTVAMLSPFVFHPNMVGGAICLGRVAPATPLVDILVQVYEMVVWKVYSAHDCLNPEAAQWARNHGSEVPLETGRMIRIPKEEEEVSTS